MSIHLVAQKGCNRPKVLRFRLIALFFITASVLGATPNTVDATDPIIGIWINKDYDKSGRYNAKWEIFQNGKEYDYKGIWDVVPAEECFNTFEELWIDEKGNHFYKIRTKFWVYPSKVGTTEGYVLLKIDTKKNVLEANYSATGYPEEISEIGSFYRTLKNL